MVQSLIHPQSQRRCNKIGLEMRSGVEGHFPLQSYRLDRMLLRDEQASAMQVEYLLWLSLTPVLLFRKVSRFLHPISPDI